MPILRLPLPSRFLVALAGSLPLILAAGCGSHAPADSGGAGGQGGSAGTCVVQDCQSNADCAGCSKERHTCNTKTHACVACTSNAQCAKGLACSTDGLCAPNPSGCPLAGTIPMIACSSSADCAACDDHHQVCDTTSRSCVACNGDFTNACLPTEQCVGDTCVLKCPATCTTSDDCSACSAGTTQSHACNAGHCAQCSSTVPCTGGNTCTSNGTCVKPCGTGGKGTCNPSNGDSDCATCANGLTQCHGNLGSTTTGTCGPVAAGCSVLGSTFTLPAPWNTGSQTCSKDADCAGISIQVDIASIAGLDLGSYASALGGLTTVTYAEPACASYTIAGQTCGLCVPCHTNADCKPLTFLGGLLSYNMVCQNVGADWGYCTPG